MVTEAPRKVNGWERVEEYCSKERYPFRVVLYHEESKSIHIHLNLHEGQERVRGSKARFVLMSFGSQSGKTSFEPVWMDDRIQEGGQGDYIAAAPTFPLMENKLIPEFRTWFGGIKKGWEWQEAKKRLVRVYGEDGKVDGKTRIIFLSAVNPEALESATAKAAVIDEADQVQFARPTWEAIQRRLALSRGRILLGTSLYQPNGWVKRDVYDKWVAGDKDYDVIQCDSTANPNFTKEEFERIRGTMPEWKFSLLHRGRYSEAGQLVYDCYDSGRNGVQKFEIPVEWPVYSGHDFGLANAAAVFVTKVTALGEGIPAKLRIGDLVVFVEYKPPVSLSVDQHVSAWRRIVKDSVVVARLGGSHQEAETRQAYSLNGWYISEPVPNHVESQIAIVYALFKQGRLFIMDGCEGLKHEIGSYSYKLDDDYNRTDEIADKASYHLCLVPGTMIETKRGSIPIERVTIKDQVLTRVGYRPVEVSAQTDMGAAVMKVTFSNGKTLTGTGNHPIWVKGKGFVPLDTLRYGDIIEVCRKRQSHTRESSLIGILNRLGAATVSTSSPPLATCIGWCGKMFTGQCQKAWSSIMRMGIVRTTTSRTSFSVMPLAIWQSICKAGWSLTNNWLDWLSYARWLLNGIILPMGINGITSMAETRGPITQNTNANVSNVGRNTPHHSRREASSAPTTAKVHIGGQRTRTTNGADVLTAGRHSLSIATLDPKHAHCCAVHVISVEPAGSSPIFNLQVDTVHEYFANGILVSNCDALRYVCVQFRMATVGDGAGYQTRSYGTLNFGRPRDVYGQLVGVGRR